MKKKLITLALGLLLASNQLAAAQVPQENGTTLAGLGAGSLAGAIAAGPAGLVIGGLIGALAGNHSDLSQQRHQLIQERRQMQQQLNTLQQRSEQSRQQIQSLTLQAAALPMARALSRELGLEISFRTASSELEPLFVQRLDAIAGMLLAFPDLRVSLSAHADRRGGTHANQRLSQQRLQRVIDALEQAGVAPQRISGRALGEAQPVSVDHDLEMYHLDRRVLLKITLPDR